MFNLSLVSEYRCFYPIATMYCVIDKDSNEFPGEELFFSIEIYIKIITVQITFQIYFMYLTAYTFLSLLHSKEIKILYVDEVF
jgi:hypothetical protein